MPFIHTKVNRPISKEQEAELSRRMGKAIALLNKSENWLMLQFEDNCRLYFKGDCQQGLAFVNVKLLGHAGRDAYERLTGELTSMISQILAIEPQGIYVEYDETDHWGWNGMNL